MKLVDLSETIPERHQDQALVRTSAVRLSFANGGYTGLEHVFAHASTQGTYIDFPGHIVETDDGLRAHSYPIDRLYRVPAAVIHLDRASESGAVTAAELAGAAPDLRGCRAIVINALGSRRHDAIDFRSVWLAPDTVPWLIATGVHLVVSDIYERKPVLTGVFADLFKAGISTVCCPVRLDELTAPRVFLSALPLPFAGATQLPCRVVAEF